MVKIFRFLFFFFGIGTSFGNPPNITCLDSSVFLFTMAIDIPQKKEILFLGNQKRLPEKQSGTTNNTKDIDIFLIVTDSTLRIKRKLVFGDPEREDVAQKVLVDSLGNYVILSQVKKLSPYDKPTPLPTMLTIINSKYEIISQKRFQGYGFTAEISKGGYIIFGSSTELGEEVQVYMAYIKDNFEVWRKNIAIKNSIFSNDEIHVTTKESYAYIFTQEQYSNRSSPNDTSVAFKHTLILADIKGNITQNKHLRGIPKYTYINEWYLKGKYLYLLLTNIEGDNHFRDKYGFAKYDLETDKIYIQFLGEYSTNMSFFPLELIDFDNHITALLTLSNEKKSDFVILKWGVPEVYREEWPNHTKFSLLVRNNVQKATIILSRNSSTFYYNKLFVKTF